MKLTYQTGIGTLVQFLLLSLFALFSQVGSVVSTCRQAGGDCLGNLLTSIIFYILVAALFGGIWLIGYAAQTRRSKRLAQLLICIEGMVGLGALFTIKLSSHQANKNLLGLIASFVILVLAAWIISLAFRLMRAGGGRVVVARQRSRQRNIHE